MHSNLYVGQVRHRRFSPAGHAFSYPLFMLYLDLDELPGVFKRFWLWSCERANIASFRRGDHMGDRQQPLDTAVRDFVEQRSGKRPAGPVRLLTHLRYFGYGFNPVSFYFCFDPQDQRVEAIVAEVNNTPWGEQYCYSLHEPSSVSASGVQLFELDKAFHVSPFMDMNIHYRWRISRPGERLTVHMQNHQSGGKLFDATLSLRRKPISSGSLALVLLRFPFMTARVSVAIYYQALRLWLKKIPFYPHPEKKEAPVTVKSS